MSAQVTPEGAPVHFANVLKAQAKRKRSEIRREQVKTAVIGALVVVVVAQGLGNYRLAQKAAAVHTVYAVLRDDGTLVNSETFSSLTKEFRDKTEVNELWDYVHSRECYASGEASRAYYKVQAMSDPRVSREFVDWYDKANPNSPQNVYGAKGVVVHCDFVSVAPSGDGDGYSFRFDRWEESDRTKTRPVRYVAPLRYRTGIYASDPRRGWVDKVTFNAAGVQVWEYPGARPEGVAGSREISSR